MAHTLTVSISSSQAYFSIKVNGSDVNTPYQLANGDVITLDGSSVVWDSGGPKGDLYTGWVVSVNGSAIFGGETTVSNNDINISAEETYAGETTPQTFSATINYTASTPQPTLTFKHFYDAGTIGSGMYKFRHYSQTEPSSGETWVLNETLTLTSNTFSANFTANNSTYTEIWMSDRELAYGDSSNVVYATKGGWIDEANKTLTFAIAPTGDLLTWLQANGTKQGGGAVIKAGTYRFGDDLNIPENVNYEATINGTVNSLTSVDTYGDVQSVNNLLVARSTTDEYGTAGLIDFESGVGVYGPDWHYVTEDGDNFSATDTTKLRTFVILEDVDVSNELLTWFTANTTKLS